MVLQYTLFGVKFSFPASFFMKLSCCTFLHDAFISGIGKEAKSQSYIKYSLFSHLLILQIKVCPFFIKLVCDATNPYSFD